MPKKRRILITDCVTDDLDIETGILGGLADVVAVNASSEDELPE